MPNPSQKSPPKITNVPGFHRGRGAKTNDSCNKIRLSFVILEGKFVKIKSLENPFIKKIAHQLVSYSLFKMKHFFFTERNSRKYWINYIYAPRNSSCVLKFVVIKYLNKHSTKLQIKKFIIARQHSFICSQMVISLQCFLSKITKKKWFMLIFYFHWGIFSKWWTMKTQSYREKGVTVKNEMIS